MRRERSKGTFYFAALVALSFLLACDNDEGEACQLDGDCAGSLICCMKPGAARGFCGDKSDRQCGGGAVTDAGPTADAATAEDAGSVVEDAAVDASTEAGADASTGDDAGASDGG